MVRLADAVEYAICPLLVKHLGPFCKGPFSGHLPAKLRTIWAYGGTGKNDERRPSAAVLEAPSRRLPVEPVRHLHQKNVVRVRAEQPVQVAIETQVADER